MTEPDQIERELAEELGRVASRSRPPADAWERFERRRISSARERGAASPGGVEPNDVAPHPKEAHPELVALHDAVASPPTRSEYRHSRRAQFTSAAVLIAVSSLGVAWLLRRSEDRSSSAPGMPESSIELRGADGNSDAIAAFAAVSAAYEAFNNGEEAVWLEVRAAPQIQVDAFALSHMAELMAAHAHLEVDHCDYVGFDEYPVEGHQGYRPVEAHQFRCDAVMTDAFTDAAGINVESNIRWLVANGRVRDASSEDPGLAEREGFVARFFTWLSAEHPEINSQDVPAALDLLDEFIASDDRYPLSD